MKNIDTDFLLKAPLTELIAKAGEIRKSNLDPKMQLCSIINAKSGRCSEDCKFCAQSGKHSTDIETYPLKSKDEMVQAAKRAKDAHAERFGIVTSGNKLSPAELDTLAQTISVIKKDIGLDVCGSLGALSKSDLQKLKDAGMTRYHHNIETSENFYPKIVSTHNFSERITTIKAAKDIGLEVCSGGIIGMGETWADRIDMAMLLKEMNVDSVPINFLVPIKGTTFESLKPISAPDAIRTICIFRIILENIPIKIAAGRESVLKDFQAMGFMAGANGMIIAGYLTVKGRKIAEDHKLVEEIEQIWNE